MVTIQIRVKAFVQVLVVAEADYLSDDKKWDRVRRVQDGAPWLAPLTLFGHLGEVVTLGRYDLVVPPQNEVFWVLKKERDRLISHTFISSVLIEAVNRLLDFVQHHGQSVA